MIRPQDTLIRLTNTVFKEHVAPHLPSDHGACLLVFPFNHAPAVSTYIGNAPRDMMRTALRQLLDKWDSDIEQRKRDIAPNGVITTSILEHWEAEATAFYKATGYLRPGKDQSPLHTAHSDEERQAAWDVYCKMRPKGGSDAELTEDPTQPDTNVGAPTMRTRELRDVLQLLASVPSPTLWLRQCYSTFWSVPGYKYAINEATLAEWNKNNIALSLNPFQENPIILAAQVPV